MSTTSNWFEYHPKRADAKLRLFCFHHLGSNANWCNQWKNLLPTSVEIIGVALPGRLRRFSEPPEEDLREAAKKIAQAGLELFKEKPFAFIGNSLGCTLSFEVLHAMQALSAPMPVHYFPCASIPPHKRTINSLTYTLDYKTCTRAELIALLRKNGGTPEEVLEHDELMDLLLPSIRADGVMFQSYKYTPHEKQLTVPLSYFGSMKDNLITDPNVQNYWTELTEGQSNVELFDNEGHFFLVTTKMEYILGLVGKTLCTYLTTNQ